MKSTDTKRKSFIAIFMAAVILNLRTAIVR